MTFPVVARKYDGAKARRPGRPRKQDETAKLVLRIAQENECWGYTRIRDALNNLGLDVGRNTVKRILLENGIEPAPERRKRTSWKTFLRAHWDHVVGADFFTVEVLALRGLIRCYVFFLIELSTRRVSVAGITCQPSEVWMKQIARNLTDPVDGFLRDKKYLILDRDPLYTTAFRGMLRDGGTKPLRLPRRFPNLNAYAERFVLSIKSECLGRTIPLGEKHIRSMVAGYVAHYHGERVHQGLGRLIARDDRAGRAEGHIACRERVGGLLRYYYRQAA